LGSQLLTRKQIPIKPCQIILVAPRSGRYISAVE